MSRSFEQSRCAGEVEQAPCGYVRRPDRAAHTACLQRLGVARGKLRATDDRDLGVFGAGEACNAAERLLDLRADEQSRQIGPHAAGLQPAEERQRARTEQALEQAALPGLGARI